MTTSILPLNKGNKVIYKNSINNSNSDKDSGSDNSDDSYNVNNIKVIMQKKIR